MNIEDLKVGDEFMFYCPATNMEDGCGSCSRAIVEKIISINGTSIMADYVCSPKNCKMWGSSPFLIRWSMGTFNNYIKDKKLFFL